MYKWTLKHRNSNESNLVNPERFITPFLGNPATMLSEYISISPNTDYQGHGDSFVFLSYYFYDLNKNLITGGAGADSITSPAGAYFLAFVCDSSQDREALGVTKDFGSNFVSYFASREVKPIYKKATRGYKAEGNNMYYRDKLDGNIKLVRDDYDYVDALAFDEKMRIEVEDLDGSLSTYKGMFYKTDCKWDADNRIVEVKTEPNDDYEDVIGGMDKTFNLIELAPELQELTIRKRPVIQIYIPGDTIITNILGGTYWEQEIQIDPEFDDDILKNTYRFSNPKNIRIIPNSYSGGLSTDVTGEYDANRERVLGGYKLVTETDSIFVDSFSRRRYYIVPLGATPDFGGGYNSTALYKTGWTNWRESGVNLLEFNGANGETGSFYFTEYRIYVRYYTDLLEVRGIKTFGVKKEDIVANNSNYRRVIGYDIDDFYIYDEFQDSPTKFGKVPDGAPDAGKYYKEFLVSAATGLSNPLPVASSQWRAVSLWFFNSLDVRYTEFIDGEDFVLRDSFPIHSVIKVLLEEMGSVVAHDNLPDYSEFLYSDTNPLGGFTFLDFEGNSISSDYTSRVYHFLTPKSNILASNYDEGAQKAEISLGQVLKMLKDIYQVYWHIEGGKLILEHVSWYQNGGTYGDAIVGMDLTQLVQPRNNKKWSFSQNKFEYDKESMPERFEFGWMDDVSKPFEGFNIQILSNYVQKGRIEDLVVNGITTDIDFMQSNPLEISKDGFALMSCVLVDGLYRLPFIEMDFGFNQKVILQNGFLSWMYLHPRYHVYNLPSDKVNINNSDSVLYQNNTRQKKQEVTFPVSTGVNPYQLIKTILGDGIVDKLDINMSSYIAKATIKHDTE